MQFWQFLADLHPKLVQFPLVLLLAALVFDAAGLLLRAPRLNFAAKLLSAGGTFFLLVAFICGIYAEIWAGRAGIPQEQIEWHELMANIASWGFVVLMAWRLFLEPEQRKALTTYTIIGLGWYSLLVITGYLGGRLVFEYGAAVVGARANDVLSLHDLNVLATRQTDDNLRYSELMHHVSGWLTLALSGSLFAHALFPKKGDRLKWVGPGLLMLGGICLFFFADLDLYHFTDLRQLRDREVQLHKTLAIVLAVTGGLGLWRLRRQHIAQNTATDADDPALMPSSDGKLSTPSKVVAVMALIGGGMLFTHVHTVAPYANVAAGVYIAHIIMGLTALGIGAARLLQDALPRFRRPLAITFATLMCLESLLLITYNEGLPWYIGYGSYNRWGVFADGSRDANSPIAPFGAIRAQLTVDSATQRLDLYVKDRFTEAAVPVPARQLNLLISRGYTEMAIPMQAAGDGDRSSHFFAVVPALKDVPAFCARVALPIGGSMKMGYFDPWVSRLINPVPPNVVPKYQCPMHDGMISEVPENCPLCGMPMVPYRLYPRQTLHDAAYDMKLEIPADIQPNQTVQMRFVPMHDGSPMAASDLAIVHEHPLHLIIVSSDLEFFDHVHPVLQPNGSLILPYAFPHAGTFLLFADITPQGQRGQVFRLPVRVGSHELLEQTADLVPDAAPCKALASDPLMTAQLLFQPRQPAAGLHTNFIFRLMRDGRPVNDLEPYIGAMGHCVVISQDTMTYLHCHPEQLLAPTRDARGGPDVPFHTIFPRAGRYKIWGQFKRNGHVVIATFVVDVASPILPPRVVNFLLDD